MVSAMTVGMTAFAAPQKMSDGQVFDPEFYAASYPDVVAAMGSDANALYQHYVLCGKMEGRLPYAAGTDVSAIVASNPQKMSDGGLFDAAFYAQTYPDVAALIGTDTNTLYNHYLTNGVAMGRLPYAGAAATTPRLAGTITIPSGYRSAGDTYTFYMRTRFPGVLTARNRDTKKIYDTYTVSSGAVVRQNRHPQLVLQYTSQHTGNTSTFPWVTLKVLIYNEAGTLVEADRIDLTDGEHIATETLDSADLPAGTYYIELGL